MGTLPARIGDAIVLIGFIALAAVLVRPNSQTGNIVKQGGGAYAESIRAATLR